MTTTSTTLNIDEFKQAVPTAKHSQKLDFALQSFAKRNEYAHIYYEDFMNASSHLPLASIDVSGNMRAKFEAYATAYVANAHAMIDSFPYVIYLVLTPLSYMDSKNVQKNVKPSTCDWNDNFYKSLLQTYPQYKKLSDMFWSIKENDDFVLLRAISNNHKHKFLTRMVNNGRRLRYEVIDPNTAKISHTEVEKFFVRVHNKLLPKIFRLYKELQRVANLP